jgi:hypothetical protein
MTIDFAFDSCRSINENRFNVKLIVTAHGRQASAFAHWENISRQAGAETPVLFKRGLRC